MYFNTGDIITARIKSMPFFLHQGIIVVDDDGSVNIWHNTPDYKNSYGGGVVKESLEDWILSREIISVEQTGLSREYIEQRSLELSARPFNITSFNCEQYISLVKEGQRKSPQLLLWGAGIAFYLLWKNSNKGTS